MWKMFDGFAGLGGASEAMVRSNKWEVMRIDNNPLLQEVEHMTIIDIKEFADELTRMIDEGYQPDSVDLVWLSPPCVEFSLGYSSPQSRANRAGEDYQPDLSHLEVALEIIRLLNPKFWVIENVRGACKWFRPIIGEPRQVINHSIFLWGNFPFIRVENIESKYANQGSSADPLRPNRRALIPYAISDALRRAIEEQRSILEWV